MRKGGKRQAENKKGKEKREQKDRK